MSRWLAFALFALAAGIALNSMLGPLALEVIEYHYSETLLNQAIGLDATALFLVAPLATMAGVLTWRGHPAGPVLAFAPSTFAAYMMPQYVIGPDYLGLPGNNENFFVLHFGLFALAAAIVVMAWSLTDFSKLAPPSRRFGRVAGIALLLLPAFMIFGLYIPGFADALSAEPSRDAYLDNPTAFWIVAFLDLAIVTPAALASGLGMLRGAKQAPKGLYAIAGWFALVPPSVAAMAITMVVNDDPLASEGGAVMFSLAAILFAVVALRLYWPLFQTRARPPSWSGVTNVRGSAP